MQLWQVEVIGFSSLQKKINQKKYFNLDAIAKIL